MKCAVYAARKEYELLVLLSTADAKVIAMARTMGQAAVHAPGEQRSEAAPTKHSQAPHRASGKSDRSREVPARRYTRVKRGKRERRQRQEAASKCQSLVRSFLVRQVRLPAARERAVARAAANPILEASPPPPVPAAERTAPEWLVVGRRGRRSPSPLPHHSSPCYSESPSPTDRRRPVSERAMAVREPRVRGERRRRSPSEEGSYKPKGRPQCDSWNRVVDQAMATNGRLGMTRAAEEWFATRSTRAFRNDSRS